MLNVGAGEMIFILVAALLILGPKRLPEMARGIGKFVREFRRQTEDVRHVVEREFYAMDQEVIPSLHTAHTPPKLGAPEGTVSGATSNELAKPAPGLIAPAQPAESAPPSRTFSSTEHSASPSSFGAPPERAGTAGIPDDAGSRGKAD